MAIINLKQHNPQIAADAYIADSAEVIGRVKIGKASSIWPGSVLRGDVNSIQIGENSNIQDGTIVHVDYDKPVEIGNYVTVGHRAVLHGCKIADGALIGMGAVLLDGVEVGENAIIAAGAVVAPGTKIPGRTLWMGIPAKHKKDLNEKESGQGRLLAKEYSEKIKGLYNA